MKNIVNSYVEKFKGDHRTARRTAALLLMLALLVTGGVFWRLHSTGIALANENFCGLEEHTHTEDCYDEDGNLICGLEEHTHSLSCLSDTSADTETASDWEATIPDDLSGTWADDVVAIAESQLGYTESTANFTVTEDGETRQGYTRYGAWAGNDYGDWDAMFASFCLSYAGISTEDFPESTGAYAWAVLLKNAGLYEAAADYTPVTGDLVFLDTDSDEKTDRVGILVSIDEENNTLTLIEGDYAAAEDDTDAVCEVSYAADDSSIIGYGTVAVAQEVAETITLMKQTLTATVDDDITVTVSGMLPTGASVSAQQVSVELEGLDVHVALDISILLADGTTYEPVNDTLAVTIESPDIISTDCIYYVPEEGDPEMIAVVSEADRAEFDAEHFSTYVLASVTNQSTTRTISTTYVDSNSNEAELTITSSSDTDLLTGNYASISITLGFHGDVDLSGAPVRIYLNISDSDAVVYGSSGGTDVWEVGETRKYKLTNSDTIESVTLCQDSNGYYLEIAAATVNAGDTLNFNISVGYDNESSDGGTITVSGAIGDDAVTNGEIGFLWTTHTDSYGVNKKSTGNASFVSNDKDGCIYLTGLAYTISSTRVNYSSYGKDPVVEFSWTDTLTLPDGLSWRDGLLAAITAGNYAVNGQNIEVTIEGVTYTLCTVSNQYSWLVQNIDVSVSGDSIQVTWSYSSNGTVQYENNVVNHSFSITYGDQVIICEKDTNGEYIATDYSVDNIVNANYVFKFSNEDQTATATATASASLSEGALNLKKEANSDTFYLGSSYDFTITAENTEALPYTGLAYIEDTLNEWLYIEPDDMESLLAAYDNLTITITGATLYDSAVSESVWNEFGNSVSITQQEQGVNTSYTGEKSGAGTLVSNDSGTSAEVTITLKKVNGFIQMTVGSTVYTVGTGGNYASLSEALDSIGYYVTSGTSYSLHWTLEDGYELAGSSSLVYTYTATVKDSFMRLTGDQFYDLNQSSSEAWTENNVAVGGTISNTVKAYNSNNEELKDAKVEGQVYRDFVLTKNYTASDSSVTKGSVVTYTVSVKHEGNATYDALPLVDQLADGQVLLVPVDLNSSNSSVNGLTVKSVDGTDYYVLDTNGTYSSVWINSDVMADTIIVDDDSTLIYCYLVISNPGTKSISYTTLVDAEGGTDGFSLKNQVWLNDHETHRLYAETSLNGSVLSIEKQIVTAQGSSPEEDATVVSSILSQVGQKVTYRLELKNNSDVPLTITATNVYDALPQNVSDNAWATGDISITVYDKDAVVTSGVLSDWASDGNWKVTVDTADNTKCYIQWEDNLSITFTGSLYIYVTLTYPDGDDWTAYYNAYRSTTLVNTFHAYTLESEVTHTISSETSATLFKGVYSTGLASGEDYDSTFYGVGENSLTYYINNSSGEYGYVQYYVVLYNEGPVNLYLQDLTDTLPSRFTYIADSAAAADATMFTLPDGVELVTGYTVDDGVSSNTSGTVTFTLSGGNLSQDTSSSLYYLKPGQAVVFTYKVLTDAYSRTYDTETNTITMPFYDYVGGGLSVSDSVSGENVTGNWYSDENPRNYGGTDILTGTDATSGDTTYSLTSTVIVKRGEIRPGITKSADVSTAGENDTITWNVTVTNDGESTMSGYYIYDVIDNPYTFTGQLTYTVYDAEGNSKKYIIGTLSMSNGALMINGYSSVSASSKTNQTLSQSSYVDVFAYVDGEGTGTRYQVKLSAWSDSDGNWVLCVYFPKSDSTAPRYERMNRAFSLSAGGKGVLSVKTVNSSGTYENTNVVNTAYIRPTQSFSQYHIGDGIEVPADSNDSIVGDNHAVETEAMVPVNYGYYTTSNKSVSELDSNGDAVDTATSSNSLETLQLTSSTSTIRYTLSVTNGDEAMTKLVMVDNLPQSGDTDPLTASNRYSDFTVKLAENQNFVVTVTTSGGVVTVLDPKYYTIVYSDSISFSASDLEGNENGIWYGTATDTTRSFRIKLNFDVDGSFTSIPANATVSVSFNAVIDGAATGGVAWNSFSYLYASNGDPGVTATPLPVGIKAPSIPVLRKQVLDTEGSVDTLTAEKEFTFLIYEGATLSDVDSSDMQALLEALYSNSIDFTEVTLKVEAGSGTAGMSLENLVKYEITEDSGTYSATARTEEWSWTNNQEYTIVELTHDGTYPFYSWNDTDYTNSYTFTYQNNAVLELICSNHAYVLPSAGGAGTVAYTAAGLALLGGTALLLGRRRRRARRESI